MERLKSNWIVISNCGDTCRVPERTRVSADDDNDMLLLSFHHAHHAVKDTHIFCGRVCATHIQWVVKPFVYMHEYGRIYGWCRSIYFFQVCLFRVLVEPAWCFRVSVCVHNAHGPEAYRRFQSRLLRLGVVSAYDRGSYWCRSNASARHTRHIWRRNRKYCRIYWYKCNAFSFIWEQMNWRSRMTLFLCVVVVVVDRGMSLYVHSEFDL